MSLDVENVMIIQMEIFFVHNSKHKKLSKNNCYSKNKYMDFYLRIKDNGIKRKPNNSNSCV